MSRQPWYPRGWLDWLGMGLLIAAFAVTMTALIRGGLILTAALLTHTAPSDAGAPEDFLIGVGLLLSVAGAGLRWQARGRHWPPEK